MSRLFAAFLLAATAATAPASAATLLDTNFDGEGSGQTVQNYNALTDFTVSGTIDLIRSGDFGVQCAGGAGLCVDLDGSGGGIGGRIDTRQLFTVNAGDRVTLSFSLSGNQRGAPADPFTAGFEFGTPFAASGVFATGPAGSAYNSGIGSSTSSSLFQSLAALPANAAFGTYTVNFTAQQSGQFRAFIATASNDSFGPVLDNVTLSAVSAVPEPASWALMIGGLGTIGGTLRRRRDAVSARA